MLARAGMPDHIALMRHGIVAGLLVRVRLVAELPEEMRWFWHGVGVYRAEHLFPRHCHANMTSGYS